MHDEKKERQKVVCILSFASSVIFCINNILSQETRKKRTSYEGSAARKTLSQQAPLYFVPRFSRPTRQMSEQAKVRSFFL